MNRKMNGKQQVSGGFDLAAFAEKAEHRTDEQGSTSKIEQNDSSTPHKEGGTTKLTLQRKSALKSNTARDNNGKSKKDPLTESAQIKLTKNEIEVLHKKAGLVPLSAFLRAHLRDSKLI